MSHVKSGGAVSQTKNMVGKRLGVKRFSGQEVPNGTIIVRQRGSVIHPGKNVKMAKDFSLYAVADGVVSYRMMTGNKRGRYCVDVLKAGVKTAEKVVAAKVAKTAEKKSATKAVKTTEKKTVTKKVVATKKTVKKAVAKKTAKPAK